LLEQSESRLLNIGGGNIGFAHSFGMTPPTLTSLAAFLTLKQADGSLRGGHEVDLPPVSQFEEVNRCK